VTIPIGRDCVRLCVDSTFRSRAWGRYRSGMLYLAEFYLPTGTCLASLGEAADRLEYRGQPYGIVKIPAE
jgi:hypothetical protein